MIPFPNIRPEIITIGSLSIRWYGLMYVIGYVLGFQLLKRRAKAGLIRINYQASESFVTYLILGMLVGARLTYALVYNWDYYSMNLLHVFKIWEGGLSFHGAALGMLVSCVLFARKHKLLAYEVTDSLGFCAAPGLFFGRMGNFINGELYGRVTDAPWAMIFPTDREHLPRHPSQLYQALTEGVLLTLILFFYQRFLLKKKQYRHGLLGGMFLMGYGILRFWIEYYREPDAQLGLLWASLSMGQILCAITFFGGLLMSLHSYKKMPIVQPKAPSAAFLNEMS